MTPDPAFAVWITGLPASGKSTLARALAEELARRRTRVCVLESDALRKILTPAPRYDEAERETFYGAVAHFAEILTGHGVPVVIDATGNRRAYRDRARHRIPNFLEVYVECPLPVCLSRDPKGIYRRGIEGTAPGVPGLSAEYEPPLRPDLVVRGDREDPGDAARTIVKILAARGLLEEWRILEANDLSARILAALRRRSGLRAFLLRLGSAAEAAGGSLWLVGGFVRDIAEGSRGRDIDLLVTGVGFDRLGRILRALPAGELGIRRIVRAGRQFPVYRISPEWAGGVIDVTPPRIPNDGNRGSGKPAMSREEAEAWEDASHRDFTMNSILFRLLSRKGRLHGKLFDPFGGIRDLRRNRIRGVGDPAERFREDPVRILRAIRLKNERPGSTIERSTWAALCSGSASLPGSCPGERIYAELSRSLSTDPSRTLSDLHRAGILARLLPEIPDWGAGPLDRTKRRYRFLEDSMGRPLPETLSLAVLLVDVAERESSPQFPRGKEAGGPGIAGRGIRLPGTEAAARRLHLPGPRRVVRMLADLCRLARLGSSPTPQAMAEAILARQPEPDHLLALYTAACRAAGRRETDVRAMRRKAARTPALLSGADLVAAGVPAGPRVEKILLAVREATLAGTVAGRNEALQLAARL